MSDKNRDETMSDKSKENVEIGVIGTVVIKDDLGNELLNKRNAIHPRNMARVFARALANEPNSSVYRIALGNGGTLTDASLNVTFNTPNDGLPPDVVDWRSRLYNETYSEIVDDTSSLLGTDPGSADQSGTRTGGGANPDGETGTGVVSNDLGNISEVIITAIINANEPNNQVAIGANQPESGSFVFDELGLYTSGASATDTTGYVNINVNNKSSADLTTLVGGETYDFNYTVDSNPSQNTCRFTVPTDIGTPTFGDLVEALNTGDSNWGQPLLNNIALKISDNTTLYPSTTAKETFGFLQLISGSAGDDSAVTVSPGGQDNGDALDMIAALNATILNPVSGSDAGVENKPGDADGEGERLLTHLIFQPIYKSSERQITVTYTLTISVGRTT